MRNLGPHSFTDEFLNSQGIPVEGQGSVEGGGLPIQSSLSPGVLNFNWGLGFRILSLGIWGVGLRVLGLRVWGYWGKLQQIMDNEGK